MTGRESRVDREFIRQMCIDGIIDGKYNRFLRVLLVMSSLWVKYECVYVFRVQETLSDFTRWDYNNSLWSSADTNRLGGRKYNNEHNTLCLNTKLDIFQFLTCMILNNLISKITVYSFSNIIPSRVL